MLDRHIKKYFSQVSDEQEGGSFYQVLVLHDSPDISWEDISARVPALPKGWFELAKLSQSDRVEFVRDYWISKLPFHPKSLECITKFFDDIEDIGVVVAQKHFDDRHVAHMIYALKNESGFFHGGAPMNEDEGIALQEMFEDVILPIDYVSFMEIHNGFSKTTDSGIIGSKMMPQVYRRFMTLIDKTNPPLTTKGVSVNPNSLIPFYESFGMPFFQCFWKDWYPENEMGNVYYSGSSHTVSDPENGDRSGDSMAFPTFLDWLFFYLEIIS